MILLHIEPDMDSSDHEYHLFNTPGEAQAYLEEMVVHGWKAVFGKKHHRPKTLSQEDIDEFFESSFASYHMAYIELEA